MDNTITTEEIQSTVSYKKINSIQQTFAIKRQNRELLTNALVVFKNSGHIAGNVHGYNIGILNDLITKNNKNETT